MAEINSPNFRRTVPTQPQTQLREFNVGPPEDYSQGRETFNQQELETNIREARKEKLASMDKITDFAKKRAEVLANIGRLSKDVVLDGFTFSLRTLKAKETKEAALQAFKANTNLELSFESRRNQLARSLYKIDGHDIVHILGDDTIETKLSFLDELEESVILKLFDEFSALKTEANSKFGVNSEAEAKEVAEDLKK